MPTYHDAFLLWDGICPADTTDAAVWINAGAVGAGRNEPPPAPEERSASASGQAPKQPGVGAQLSIQRAAVQVVNSSAFFAPAQEHCLIKLRIKDIATVRQMVLQIRDIDGRLVYAERLSAQQVWGLWATEQDAKQVAPRLAIDPDRDRGAPALDKRRERGRHGWADPVNGPYRISVLLRSDATEIPLDAANDGLPTEGAGLLRHSTGAVQGARPPRVAIDETSVRLHSLGPLQLLEFEQVYEALTHEPWPAQAPGDPRKDILWAKCRLNSLGIYAGPIDHDERHPDFGAALVRYRTIRGIAGQAAFTQTNIDQEPTHRDDLAQLQVWNGGVTPAWGDGQRNRRTATGAKSETNVLRHLELEDPSLHPRVRKEVPDAEPSDDPSKFGSSDESYRVYVDANRFYISTPEFESNRKQHYDSQWITRPCLPLRAAVRFERRDGQGQGQEHDGIEVSDVHARSGLRLLWRCAGKDEEKEDTETLPSADNCANASFQDKFFHGAGGPDGNREAYVAARQTYGTARLASQTRAYVDKTKQVMHAHGPSHRHNARSLVGGLVTQDDAADARNLFARLEPGQSTARPAIGPREVLGTPASVCVAPEYVYLRPSIIAGDRYRIVVEIYVDPAKVELSLSAEERERLVEADDLARIDRERDALAAVVRRFCDLNGHAFENAIQSSAMLTIWRRLRVAQLIDWPNQTRTWDGRNFDFPAVWSAVRAEYGFSYIELPPAASVRRSNADTHARLQSDYHELMVLVRDQLGDAFNLDGPLTLTQDHVFPDCVPIPRLEVRDGSLPSMAWILQKLIVDSFNNVLAPWTGGPPPPPRRFGQRAAVEIPLDEKIARGEHIGRLLQFMDLVAQDHRPALVDRTAASPADVQGLLGAAAAQLRGDLRSVLEQVPDPAQDPNRRTHKWRQVDDPPVEGQPITRSAFNPVTAGQARFRATRDTSCVIRMARDRAPRGEQLQPGDDPDRLDAREYDARQFAGLFDALWMPPSVRAEIEAWSGGGSSAAPNTTLVYRVLDYIFTNAKPAADEGSVDEHILNASKHFHRWYASILDVPNAQFQTGGGVSRRIRKCPIDRVAQEKKGVQKKLAACIQHVFSRIVGGLDLTIRHELLNTPNGPRYGELSNGAIILNVVMYPEIRVAGEAYRPFGGSMGCGMGVAVLSQQTMLEPYALWAHEIGHTLFMQHFRNASGYLFDHDHSDTNCAMSYPLLDVATLANWQHLSRPEKEYEARVVDAEAVAGYQAWPQIQADIQATKTEVTTAVAMHVDANALPQIMRSHFCGKCNLKLRGWNIHAARVGPPPAELVGQPGANFVLPISSGAALPTAWPEPTWP